MAQNNNTLTVIIPTYQRPRLLKRAVLSVMKQNHPGVKIMVFDNDSGDETKEAVSDLMSRDSRISYYCHEKNIGAPANFVFGARQVDTAFFAFLSDDDIVMPDCYRNAIDILTSDETLMLVANKAIIIDEYYNLMGPSLDQYTSGRFNPLKTVSTIPVKRMPPWTGMVFRSDIIVSIGVPDPEILIGDAEYIARVCYHFPFVVTDKIGAVFTVTQAGYKKDHYLLEQPASRERMYDLFQSEYCENKAIGELWARKRKKYYRKIFKRGIRWIHEENYQYVTEAVAILESHQSKLKSGFLTWLLKTASGKRFFNVTMKPCLRAKDFFKNRKPPGKRGRAPNSSDVIQCINYFKSLEDQK